MPFSDADRWNERYRASRNPSSEQPRPFLLENATLLPDQGLALDLAMGLGGNTGFLLARGLRVIGVDISAVAARQVKRRLPEVEVVVADLTRFYLPPDRFDLIINFYYLQRDLWLPMQAALRPGGIVVYEMLSRGLHKTQPDINPEYLLQPGELQSAFPGLKTMVYREGWTVEKVSHPKPVASLVAQKPVMQTTFETTISQ